MVCLFGWILGRIKKKEKMGRERKFWSVWFGVFVDGKLAGSRVYFLAYQNVFSLNWGEN